MKLLTLCAVGLLGCLSSCGGGAPSDLAPFEIGLVGQYELVELVGQDFDIVHQEGQSRLGDMLLQDDNFYEQHFSGDAFDILQIFETSGEWSATLSTISFDNQIGGYDTSKDNDIGADIGDTLTIELGDLTYVWLKITIAPRN